MLAQCHTKKYSYKFNKKLILIVGNIGSGKSTYSKKLKKDYVIISRDALRCILGNGDYVFLNTFEPAVHRAEMAFFEGLLESGVNLVVDETNSSLRVRAMYLCLAKLYKYHTTAIVLPKLSKKECVDRRMNDSSRNYTRTDWEKVWDMFDRIYEEPTRKEGFNRIIKVKQ